MNGLFSRYSDGGGKVVRDTASHVMKVFRIHTKLDIVVEHLVNERHYREVACIDNGYRLFVTTIPTKPRWHPFLKSITKENLPSRNRTASFVLLRPMDESTAYAVTGGFGTYAIRPFIDPNFGLDIVQRLVEADDVKMVRQQTISGNVLQEERVFKRPQNFANDPLSWLKIPRHILAQVKDKDYLSEKLGLPLKDRRSISLEGTKGFTIRRSLSFSELNVMLTRMHDLLAHRPRMNLLQGCLEVTDKEDRERLFQQLHAHLNEIYRAYLAGDDDFDDNSVIIISDDVREWLLCTQFHISMEKKRSETDDMQLEDLLSAFAEWKLDAVPDLREIRIDGLGAEGERKISGKALDFIIAEVTCDGQSYVLIDKRWYRTTSDFAMHLDGVIKRFLVDDERYTLPEWPQNEKEVVSETDYTLSVLKNVDGIIVLHTKHLHAPGTRAELCDAFDTRNGRYRLVFVKRGLNQKCRELARQAVDAILLATGHSEYRLKAIERLRKEGVNIDTTFEFRDCDVVLAVVDTDTRANRSKRSLLERMRLIAKIEFAFALEFLRSQVDGNVWLYEVPTSEGTARRTSPLQAS